MPIYAVFLVVALLGGGVSAAAQTSLPGDTLYPVKVNVNEEVRAALTVGADAKASYEVRRIERRLEEAEKVTANGDLTAEVKAEIEKNFEAHADRVEARIADFEAKENFAPAAEVAVKFQTSLEAHEQILAKLAEKGDGTVSTGDIAESVRVRAEAADVSRVSLEYRIFSGTGEASDERIIAYAEQIRSEALSQMRSVAEYIESNSKDFSSEVVSKVRMELRAAKNLSEQGTAKLNEKNYREAVRFFQQARQVAQSAMVFLRAESDISGATEVDFGIEFKTRVISPVDVVPAMPIRIDGDDSIDGEDSIEFEIEEEHGVFFLDTRSSNSGSGKSIAPMPLPVDPERRDVREIEVRGNELEIKGIEGKVEIKL